MCRGLPGACWCRESSFSKVETPLLPVAGDGSVEALLATPVADGDAGTLAPVACRVLMKILYAARVARWDLLMVVALLASRVTQWNANCDLALHRLVSYIHCSIDCVL